MPSQPQPQTTATGRVEAFSDAVFAIALTLLVLDLRVPPSGRFVETLLDDWAAYLAYLIAFFTIGAIWLSHHDVFSRVRRADPLLLVLNLGLLLGSALVPWPTSLVSAALRRGEHEDQVAAIVVYSLVTLLVGLSFALMGNHLARHPELLRSAGDQPWMRRSARRSSGTVVVALVGAGLSLVAPVASLVLYLLTPAAFLLGSLRARRTDAEDGPVEAAE